MPTHLKKLTFNIFVILDRLLPISIAGIMTARISRAVAQRMSFITQRMSLIVHKSHFLPVAADDCFILAGTISNFFRLMKSISKNDAK